MKRIQTCRRLLLAAVLIPALLHAAAVAAEERVGDFYPAEKSTAAGRATLVEAAGGARQVRLSEDFVAPYGPDLFVVLIKSERPQTGREVRRAGYVALGRLESLRGSQSYPVPADLDAAGYDSVGIWCEEFGVLFAAAPLAP